MTRILALDTSSDACSVALLTAGGVEEDFRLTPREHTRLILPMIDGLLAQAGLRLPDLDAIAFGRGPGSFTGLRIAAGVVQGLAWGAQLPVIAVSTLAAMALEAARETGAEWVLPVLDARMDELYTGLYRVRNDVVELVAAERVCSPENLTEIADAVIGELAIVGSGLVYESRFPGNLIGKVRARDPDLQPRAGMIATLAAGLWAEGKVLRPDEVQPIYLRDEIAWNKLPGR